MITNHEKDLLQAARRVSRVQARLRLLAKQQRTLTAELRVARKQLRALMRAFVAQPDPLKQSPPVKGLDN